MGELSSPIVACRPQSLRRPGSGRRRFPEKLRRGTGRRLSRLDALSRGGTRGRWIRLRPGWWRRNRISRYPPSGGHRVSVYRLIRGRSQRFQTAGGPDYGANYSNDNYRDPSYVESTPAYESQDPEEVLHQAEPQFDARRFRDARLDDFFKVQAAFANRDLSPLRDRMTPELYQLLDADVAELKRAGRVNHLDNIAVRDVEIAEAWRETGSVWATVRFRANLVDYTTDERSGAVVSGSRTEPVKFQELWSFVREVGFSATSNEWRLSAIEQEQE